MLMGTLLSIQPTFYPQEAEKKGASASQYGLVFGISNLAGFFMAPFTRYFVDKCGTKKVFTSAIMIIGSSTVAFGCLVYTNDLYIFLGFSYALKFILGMCNTVQWSAGLSIIMGLNPEMYGTAIAIRQSTFGVGYLMGPVLGSVLYAAGGFQLPFWTVGGLCLLCTIGISILIPSLEAEDKQPETVADMKISMKKLIFSQSILIPLLDIVMCFAGTGFIESMLEPFMRKSEDATQLQISIAFTLLGIFNMASSVITGRVRVIKFLT